MEHQNKRTKFLELLSEFGVVREACRGAGVSRTHMYRLRENDDEFRGRWDEALEESIEAVEAEARRRAMEKSDLLIIFWLKAHRPERYRETRALMSPTELQTQLDKEIEAQVNERVEQRLREMNAQVN